jgi:hypothetical protein
MCTEGEWESVKMGKCVSVECDNSNNSNNNNNNKNNTTTTITIITIAIEFAEVLSLIAL